jgi:hypothetical protein
VVQEHRHIIPSIEPSCNDKQNHPTGRDMSGWDERTMSGVWIVFNVSLQKYWAWLHIRLLMTNDWTMTMEWKLTLELLKRPPKLVIAKPACGHCNSEVLTLELLQRPPKLVIAKPACGHCNSEVLTLELLQRPPKLVIAKPACGHCNRYKVNPSVNTEWSWFLSPIAPKT